MCVNLSLVESATTMTQEQQPDPRGSRRWGEPERRSLLVHIEHYWHNTGTSPSYTYLADVYRTSSGSVRYHCEQLEASGFLELHRQTKGTTARGRTIASVAMHLTMRGREEAYKARWRHQL